MHLDPSGRVRVCELNTLGMLGTITEARLPELWHGERARRVRAALRRDDLGMGCEACATTLRTGERALTHAAYYDEFNLPATDRPEWPVQLELSLSNACNLQCVMCDGDLSSAIRAHREGLPPLPKVYDDQFFEDLRPFLPHLRRVTFIGGEPFLGAETLRVFDMLCELPDPPSCWITTNGTVFNRRVERVLDTLRPDVSISIDGATAATYEAIRPGSSYRQVMSNLERFREHAGRVSVNFCLMVPNWTEFHDYLLAADAAELDVHVNTVTGPKRLSLYQLPAAELRGIVTDLERRDASALGRSRRAWDEQLGRLRGHLDSMATTSPVSLGRTSTPERHAASPPDQDLAEWGDERGVAVLRVGRSELVLAAEPEPGDVLGMDIGHLIGGHLTGMVAAMETAFGEMVSSELQRRDDGAEERLMSFRRNGSVTTIRALLVDGDAERHPGELTRWLLAARTMPADGPNMEPGPQPS